MDTSALATPAAAPCLMRLPRPIAARRTAVSACLRAPMPSLDRSLLEAKQPARRSRKLEQTRRRRLFIVVTPSIVPPPGGVVPRVLPEAEVPGLSQFLDTLKFDTSGMLVAIVQVRKEEFFPPLFFSFGTREIFIDLLLFISHSLLPSSFRPSTPSPPLHPLPPQQQHIDTGELLMQAFSDRAAVSETLQTGLATFRSRSRGGRWCKGETSGHYLLVSSVHADCDGDSLVYLSRPIGPACHTGAPSCWFSVAEREGGGSEEDGATPPPTTTIAARSGDRSSAPLPTLLALERTIAQRAKEASEASSSTSSAKKPSWTAKLLADPELLCSKVREEADELCRALEDGEGKERVASEAADLLYHAAVLMNLAGVGMEDVGAVLRKRFGTSGVAEKASRKK